MKLITPNYYQQFQCIAGQCRHNCCIGWEIDIDPDTLAYYQALGGELGARLKQNISTDGTPHFILGKEERCPFLNEKNLCDIMTAVGEEGLCSICHRHPRFYNRVGRRTELGLGLCCEAAGQLILSQKEPTAWSGYSFPYKKRVLRLLQNRKLPLEQRLQRLAPALNPAEWLPLFRSLERLDPQWDRCLDLVTGEASIPKEWELPFEQLAVSFAYRHILPRQRKERCAFAVLSTKLIAAIFAGGEQTMENLVELTRLYSSEIEYSDENPLKILEAMARRK